MNRFSEEWYADRLAKAAPKPRLVLIELEDEPRANDSEHDHQAALIEWANLNAHLMPELARIFAVPNGAKRSRGEAGYLLAEGLKKGVSDLFLLAPRRGHHGLIIEMKSGTGTLTAAQRDWLGWFEGQGFLTGVAYSYRQARNLILLYLGFEEPLPNQDMRK